MAQRVYLVPTPDDVRALFEQVVLAPSAEDLDRALARCAGRVQRHLLLNRVSVRNARRLNEKAFDAEGRGDDYHLYIGLRPYLVTTRGPLETAQAVSRALEGSDAGSAQAFFDEQLAALPPGLLLPPDDTGPEEAGDGWTHIEKELRRLWAMREAIRLDAPFTLDTPKEELIAAGIRILGPESETRWLRGVELRQAYATRAGYIFARLCAKCEPTWWLGRDFWPGLLLAWRWNVWSFLVSPRSLLPSLAGLAVPEWEPGFPLLCEGYTSGLYFDPEAVVAVRESLATERRGWVQLGMYASGYPADVVTKLLDVAAEAFQWASSRSCGLMEADEVGGALGYR
jgi:hypothetical protein